MQLLITTQGILMNTASHIDFKLVRISLGLTQRGMALLLNVSLGSIRNWEQKSRTEPIGLVLMVYKLLADLNYEVIYTFVREASLRTHTDAETAKCALSELPFLIRRFSHKEKRGEVARLVAITMYDILTANSHFPPEELGLKKATINTPSARG